MRMNERYSSLQCLVDSILRPLHQQRFIQAMSNLKAYLNKHIYYKTGDNGETGSADVHIIYVFKIATTNYQKTCARLYKNSKMIKQI